MNSLHGIQYVALSTPQRRKAQQGKVRLKPANIAAAKGKVVSEISRAAPMCFMHSHRTLQERRFQLQHIRAKQGKFARKLFQYVFVQISHEGQTRLEYPVLTYAMLRNDYADEHDLEHIKR